MDIFLLPVLLGLVVVIPVVRPMAVPQSLMSAELNLTPTQQQRLQEIHTRAQDNALALLTPDQQAQWTPDSLWQNTSHLDLTPEQRRQLAALRLRTLSQMYQVLTPAQRQQWQAQR